MKLLITLIVTSFFLSLSCPSLLAQSRVDFEWLWLSNYYTRELPGELVLSDSGTIFSITRRGNNLHLLEVAPTGKFKRKEYYREYYINTRRNNLEKRFIKGADRNFYLTGAFDWNGEFDLDISKKEGYDAFFVKYNQDGRRVWSKKVGGLGFDEAFSMTADKQGNVFAFGSFSSTADLDPGPDSFFLTTSNSYDRDFFVLKLDSNGNFLWAKQFVPTTAYSSYSENYSCPTIQTDDSGNVYIAGGQFRGKIDVDPGSGTFETDSFGEADFFICKLSPSGQFMWTKSFGGKEYDGVYDMVVGAKGDVYFTGRFQEIIDFDPGPGVHELGWSGNSGNVFVAKLNGNGNFKWAKEIGYISNVDAGTGLALGLDGHVYLTGKVGLDTDFDPGPDTFLLKGNGGTDIFILKLAENGEFVWAKRIGANAHEKGNSIAVDTMNNIYITGEIQNDSVDFDFGENNYYRSALSSSGGLFILKIRQCNTDSTFHFAFCDSVVSPSGKYVWKQPGIHHDTIPNAKGCDSILKFHLEQYQPVKTTMFWQACGSFTSLSGKYVWKKSGIYHDTLSSLGGCDSVVKIHLTINPSQGSTLVVRSCGPYVSPSGKQLWTKSGEYTEKLKNRLGCDSLVTVLLTVEPSSVTNVGVESCTQFTSPSGKYIWNKSGTYYDTLPGQFCDSVIQVSLTVTDNIRTTLVETTCSEYQSASGKYTWKESGIYHDTLITSGRCDSIVTVFLEIKNLETEIVTGGGVFSSSVPNAKYKWQLCHEGMLIPMAGKNQQQLIPGSGSYAVITELDGCIDTSECTQQATIGLFPNPTEGVFFVNLGNETQNVSVILKNTHGRVIETYSYSFVTTAEIDIAHLAPAVYFVEIEDELSRRRPLKLVKHGELIW